jgi:alpha/beta superfamily hydrolase
MDKASRQLRYNFRDIGKSVGSSKGGFMPIACLHPVFPWEGQSPMVAALWILIPLALIAFIIVRLLARRKKR